jgi:hypothetical protein
MVATIPQITLREPHLNQKRVLVDRSRFRVVVCGRRFGKTELGKIASLNRAVRGERVWWLAPTWDQGQGVWRDIKVSVAGMRDYLYVNNSERLIEFPGGGNLQVKTTGIPENLRGAGLDFVVFDEAAFMFAGIWGEIVRPMLLEKRGDALFLSTPFGRNWFWQVYQWGVDPLEPEWNSHHYSTMDNPLIDADEIESLRRRTAERTWREEYLAEFMDGDGLVFRGIDGAMGHKLDVFPVAGRRYFFGVDWGKDNDYTVIAVIDADQGALVALDRFNQIGWHFQRERLMTMFRKWRPVVVWAEENSIGSVNIDALQREGLPVRPFQTTHKSKQPLIEGLALALERGDLKMIPDEVLRSELLAYTVVRLPGGGFRYSAPSGGHDDTVIAAALAWHGVGAGSGTVIFA